MNDDHFLTTDEVLDYLQINLRTVYRLIKAGKIPAVRVGRLWRFRKKDIDNWLNGRRGKGNLDHPHVLVIDDDDAVRDLMAQTLLAAEYDVDTAPDGPTALEMLKGTAEYDLIITDLKMPGMDGLSVIREIRRQFATLPIIIMTGFSTEASAIEALNMGVTYYLTKPFRMPKMLAVAARALGEPEPQPDATLGPS
jgi:excisionase family DNA binding protein